MRFGLVAAAAVALAPAAHGQATGCAVLHQILASAPGGFADLKGEEIDDGWFDSKLWLADAEDCSIEIGASAEYSCVWDAGTPAAANTKTVLLSEAAKLCMPDWKVEDLAGRKSFNNLTIVKGVSMTPPATGATNGKGVVLEIHTETFENSQESSTWLAVRPR